MSELEYFPIHVPGAIAYPDEITIRQFGKDEVAHYDRLRRTGSETAVRSLIGGTIRGIPVDELYQEDFLFMMMWHRVNSFLNFPMKLPWTCPTCEVENTDELDLAKIVSEELSEDYDPGGNTIEFPCGIPITLRLPKMGDEAKSRRMLTSISVPRVDEDMIRKAETVQMMEYDENFNDLEKWEIVTKAFTVEDTFLIEGFKREFAFGPSTRQVCNCKGCGGQQNVGFRFSLLEFLPSDYDSGSIRARILHARPTRDAAKRAKENLLPRSSLVATEASEKARRSGQGAEKNPGQSGGDEVQNAPRQSSAPVNARERLKANGGPIIPTHEGKVMEEGRTEASDDPAPVVSRELTGAEVTGGR
jgi:hypothetical protein